MFITTNDGVRLSITDWGHGRPVVLVHAWALDSHMWNAQLPAFTGAGLRVVAIDRRGHGRSDVPGTGYDLDTLAADIGQVLDQLDLHDVVLVGHSMGAAEVARLIGGHGCDRVGQVVLSAPATPCVTARPDNPRGIPAELIAANRAAMAADISGWIDANSDGYWGATEANPLDHDWTRRTIHATPLPVLLATNDAFARADLRPDVARITVPTLVIQGDADRSTPLAITGVPTAELLPDGRLVVVEGAGHGIYTSYSERYNAELLAFAGAKVSAG